MARPIKRNQRRRIANERIERLFAMAEEWHRSDPGQSRNCIGRARKIAMRERIRIPVTYRRRFCRHCNTYLTPGVNQRIRIQNNKVVTTCLICHTIKRYPVVQHNAGKDKNTQ